MRRIYIVGLCIILVFSSSLTFLEANGYPEGNHQKGSGADLIITYTHTVSGWETWNNVYVTDIGKLIVPAGATFDVTNIHIQSGSIVDVTGGDIILSSPEHAADVRFNGTCDYFNVTNGSDITMIGSDGYADTSSPGPYNAYIPVSKGGDAEINITVTQGIRIENSTMTLVGGNGFDLSSSTSNNCNSWTNGLDLTGYAAAGGNASAEFNFIGSARPIVIGNMALDIMGGNGGKAADGGNSTGNPGARGGGYVNGAVVSGHVGSGGSVDFFLNSDTSVDMSNSNLSLTAGFGGDAGDGGSSLGYGGSGGGGYCGGNGVSFDSSSSGSGGMSTDYVGMGGHAQANFISQDYIELFNSRINITGGNGGDAGNGGTGIGSSEGPGGRGGGGYGGGGGGGYYSSSRLGGHDGFAYDFVGSGGNSNLGISSYEITLNTSTINVAGGEGGRAGDGGSDTDNPGGGGYGGGGGGYYMCPRAGNGNVQGSVGCGGEVEVTVLSSFLNISSSELHLEGGSGGDAGDGGYVEPGSHSSSGATGSGGGGGYGGGGGTRSSPSGNAFVSGNVGMGGESTVSVYGNMSIIKETTLYSKGGDGGKAGNGGHTNDHGGAGGGGYGGGGAADANGRGGDYTVEGNVGRGADSNIFYDSMRAILLNTSLISYGGIGGDGGSGGTKNHPWVQSAGGGGYGGGGGGTGGAYRGGYGDIIGFVGDGGNSSTELNINRPTISSNSQIESFNGSGGFAPDSPGEGGCGGEGEGRITSGGVVTIHIPMSIPLLISPPNNTFSNVTPSFEWLSLHDSTTNDSLSNYVLEIDNDNDFSSPEIAVTCTNSYHSPNSSLPSGLYYWRILARYSTPPGSNAGWSDVWEFTVMPPFYNISLSEGWNLISIPLVQSNESIEQVLSSISGKWDCVQTYDPLSSEPWKTNNTYRPYQLNDLGTLNHRQGFWIDITEPGGATLTVNGCAPNYTSINLYVGWNLVGYPTQTEMKVSTALWGTGADIIMVCDTSEPYNIKDVGPAYMMKPNEGYWIHVPFDTVWVVDW